MYIIMSEYNLNLKNIPNVDFMVPNAIALVQVFFFIKLSNVLFNNDKKKIELKYPNARYNTPEYEKAMKKYNEQRDFNDEIQKQDDHHRFMFVIVCATLLFLFVNFIDVKDELKYGVSLGALYMTGYTLFMNWNNFKDEMKVTILGLSFISLLYATQKFDVVHWFSNTNNKNLIK
jgi:hypothetical protein